jgi:hypothetical protein
MRLTRPGILAAALLGLAIGPTGAARGQTVLRWKFRDGESFRYPTQLTMSTKMKIKEFSFQMTSSEKIDSTWTVERVDKDGAAHIRVVVDRFRFHLDSDAEPMREMLKIPAEGLDFDSKNPKPDDSRAGQLFASVVKGLVGKASRVTLNATGTADDVELPEPLLDAMAEAEGRGLMTPPYNDFLSVSFLETALIGGGLTTPLPDEAVTRGKTWTNRRDFETQSEEGEGHDTFTYRGRKTLGGRAVEEIESASVLKIRAKPGATVGTLKSGTGKGTIWFDNETGRLYEAASTTHNVRETRVEGVVGESIADMSVYSKLIPSK